MNVSESTTLRGRYAPEPVRITNWPLRDDPLWAWLLAVACLALGAFAGAVTASPLMGLVAFAMVALSAWRLWVPVTFDLSSKGVVQQALGTRRRIPWRQIARYQLYRGGVLLLADSEPTLLSPLRSVFVKWKDQELQLRQLLSYYLDRSVEPAGSTTEPFVVAAPEEEPGTP